MSMAEDVGRSCLTRDNYEIEWAFLSRGKSGQFCSRLHDWITTVLQVTTRLQVR